MSDRYGMVKADSERLAVEYSGDLMGVCCEIQHLWCTCNSLWLTLFPVCRVSFTRPTTLVLGYVIGSVREKQQTRWTAAITHRNIKQQHCSFSLAKSENPTSALRHHTAV